MNLYNIFIYTVPFLIVLSLLVFMHEFGHYLVAKYFGVHIETFSIGFGKAIYSFRDRHKTIWKISILPLGGYVKMFGDSSEDSAPDHKILDDLSQDEKEMTFFYKKPWQKILIAAAGPLMNFFLAIVIITALFFFHGYPEASNVIVTVAEGSVAAKAGLLPGDQIIAINQHKTSSMNEIKNIITLNNNQKTDITFKRAGVSYTINLTPETKIIQDSFGKEIKIGYLGLATDVHYVKNASFFKAGMLAIKETYNLSINTLKALKQIIIGQRSYKELGGPLHIAGIIGNTAKIGIIPLIWLAAIISANLGLINLLPIPALDGGHIICYSWELIFSKPLTPTYQLTAFRIGMYFIIAVFLFITFNDIRHLIYKIS